MFSVVTVIDDTGDPLQDLSAVEDVLAALDSAGGAEINQEIQTQITRFSKIIAQACDRDFSKEYVSEQFFLDRNMRVSKLPLSRYPVETVFSVFQDGVELASSNYQIDPETGLLHNFCGWYGCNVVVIYTGGYDLPDNAPAALSQACINSVVQFQSAGTRDSGIRALEDQGTRVEYFGASTGGAQSSSLPTDIWQLIAPFKKWRA